MNFSHESIFNLFLLISAIHGFLFCAIILKSKNGKEKSMIYINLLVLSISLNNIQSWILAKDFFIEYFFLDYIHVPWHFLTAPFFYMFLIHYLGIEKHSKKLLKIILPTFILVISIRIGFVYFFSHEDTNEIIHLFEKYTSLEEVFSLIISITVFFYSFHILSKKENLFSKILTFDNLKWIYSFFKLGLLTYICWIIALSITIALDYKEFIYSYYPLRILTTILIYWIGFQAIFQLRLLKHRMKIREILQIKTFNVKEKAVGIMSKSNLHFIEINSFIKNNKKYTDPKICLESLARDLKISSSNLSSIINNVANKSFNEYINSFRVELAKKLLTNAEYNNYTVTAIGLESGFNSKSTFYHTFKRFTGQTPLKYQNQHYGIQ